MEIKGHHMAIRNNSRTVKGNYNIIFGTQCLVIGNYCEIYGDKNTIRGDYNNVYGPDNLVIGNFNRNYQTSNKIEGSFNLELGTKDDPLANLDDFAKSEFDNFTFELESISHFGSNDTEELEKNKKRKVYSSIKDTIAVEGESTCVICLENKVNVTITDCKHACMCSGCSKEITECPMCRKKITHLDVVYLS